MGLVWAVAILASLLLLIHLSTSGRNLVDVTVSDEEVTVTPKGLNKLWAFKGQISVPISSIRSVRLVTGLRDLPMGIRWPGTAIPGLIVAGTYRKGGERSFYAIRDGRDVVLIELDGHEYRRVGFQTNGPQEVVDRISSARNG
ncbi:MAG TPA: hypothetical protein VNP73_10645 [Actinomycetota bacterium]|nr:hypothetical protein [Actinomycetota bacterium]